MMDANLVLSILNNDTLTTDERNILLKKLAQESLKDVNKANKRDELIEKNRRQAAQNRFNLKQINYNSQIKYEMEVLSFLKNDMGADQFSKDYLQSLSSTELSAIYEDCFKTMPEAMKMAKEERDKFAASGKIIFDDMKIKKELKYDQNNKLDDTANRLGVSSDDLSKIAMHKTKTKRLDENLSGQRIVKEEDGSRFTKVKGFFKKHWKKVLAAGAIVGGAALTYFLLKHGISPDVPDPSITPDVGADPSPVSDQTPVQPDSNFIDSLNRTDVGTIDKTYDENQFVINDINAETPNEYHQNEIINAVTADDKILPAETVGDIADYKANGENITSIQVGDQNGIDGHVSVDKVIDDDFMHKYQEYKNGGLAK